MSKARPTWSIFLCNTHANTPFHLQLPNNLRDHECFLFFQNSPDYIEIQSCITKNLFKFSISCKNLKSTIYLRWTFRGKIQEQEWSFFHFNLQWKSSLRHDACMYTKNYISISTLKDVPKKSLQHFKPVFCDHHFAFKILWIKGDGTKYAHIPWRQVIHPSHHSV